MLERTCLRGRFPRFSPEYVFSRFLSSQAVSEAAIAPVKHVQTLISSLSSFFFTHSLDSEKLFRAEPIIFNRQI
jgi:hypothetical protein